jgi:hypothetical protein
MEGVVAFITTMSGLKSLNIFFVSANEISLAAPSMNLHACLSLSSSAIAVEI